MVHGAKSLLSLCAGDIMSRQVVMIPREMSLQGAARMLARAGVTGAPVVDANGRCIGVLSATDFMHSVELDRKNSPMYAHAETMCKPWQMQERSPEPNCTVDEIMTKDPVLVVTGTTLGELARMMMDAHIHRLIVVDAVSQRPVGVVSSMDVLAAVARAHQAQPEGNSSETLHDRAKF
jgi:predicted transcriptional regulator